MAIRPIRTFGDPVLRQRARPVERVTDDHRALIRDMLETMREAPGVGLAATQIGVLDRIFVYEVEEAAGAVINPVIERASEEQEDDDEGCLSIPGLVYPVTRSARVTLAGMDERGRPVSLEAEGLLARVFQHETDHLDGLLFVDRLAPEARKEALRRLRDQALGISSMGPVMEVKTEGSS